MTDTSSPLEIELKLALPVKQVPAFLRLMARRRIPPVKQKLHTLYFDTAEFELSRQGVALRIRRAGRRWLQTLKTEGVRSGGLSTREEYETPTQRGALDWSRFPEAAQARVSDDLRARLGVRFETRFQRTAWQIAGAGRARIEVALDVGEVRADDRFQPVCEIELELLSGSADALFTLAQAWALQLDLLPLDLSKAERGVRLARGEAFKPVKSVPLVLTRGMTVEDGFAATCQACLAQFQANLPGVLASDDIEYVHQARVSLRRLRAALRVYRKACVLPQELLDGLRVLVTALGPTRDWDVLCSETLAAIAPSYDDAGGWQDWMVTLETRRASVRAAMRETLASAHPGAWLLAFQHWLQQRGWRAASPQIRLQQMASQIDVARGILKKGHRGIVDRARVFERLSPLERHALRIAIKRQRYAAEFFQGLFDDGRQVRYLELARSLQDTLGLANDAHIAAALLADSGLDEGRAGGFAQGWLAAKIADLTGSASPESLQEFTSLRAYW